MNFITKTPAEKLDIARKELQKEKSMVTMVGLYTAVKEATNNLIFNKETKVKPSTVAESWLMHFSNGLVKSTGPGHHGPDIDRFFGVILTYNLMPELIRDPENARILACVSLARVLASDSTPHPAIHHVGHVIQAWFGSSVDHSSIVSLPAFVDCIYGPGVWDLYAMEVSDIKQVPSHLYKTNLTIKGPVFTSTNAQSSHTCNLPYDM